MFSTALLVEARSYLVVVQIKLPLAGYLYHVIT